MTSSTRTTSVFPALNYNEGFTPAQLLKLHPELNGSVFIINRATGIDDILQFTHPVVATGEDSHGDPIDNDKFYLSIHIGQHYYSPRLYRSYCLLDDALINTSTLEEVEVFGDITTVKATIKGARAAAINSTYFSTPHDSFNWIREPMILPPDYTGSYTPPPGYINLCGKGGCCLDVIYLGRKLPDTLGGGYAPTIPLRHYYNEWLSKRGALSGSVEETPSLVVSDLLGVSGTA